MVVNKICIELTEFEYESYLPVLCWVSPDSNVCAMVALSVSLSFVRILMRIVIQPLDPGCISDLLL